MSLLKESDSLLDQISYKTIQIENSIPLFVIDKSKIYSSNVNFSILIEFLNKICISLKSMIKLKTVSKPK